MANYGSLADANTFFATDFSGTWSNYSDAQKTKALEEATRVIDSLQFKGEKYLLAPSQVLQFPRFLEMPNRTLIFSENLSTGAVEVPDEIEQATYIQAKYILDTTVGSDNTGQALKSGLSSISIGSTSESYDKSISPINLKYNIVNDAWNLLEKYLLIGW